MPRIENHEFSIYDCYRNLAFIAGSKKTDLLMEIGKAQAYLVDTNVPWKDLAIGFPSSAFVLGRTLDNETNDLHGTFFGRKSSDGLRNVFVLEIREINKVRCVVIHRFDPDFRATNGRPIPSLQTTTEEEREQFNSAAKRDELRDRIWDEIQKGTDALDSDLADLLPFCRRDFSRSCLTAEKVYARFLLSLGRNELRKEAKKFDENHPNLFGDTCLIQEALLLGIGVVSADMRDVSRMAAIARVEFKHPERFG